MVTGRQKRQNLWARWTRRWARGWHSPRLDSGRVWEKQKEEAKEEGQKEEEKEDVAAEANVLKRDLGLLQASIHRLSVGACIHTCAHTLVRAGAVCTEA